MNNTEQLYKNILMLSADSPERLRACDVNRVLEEAEGAGVLVGFRGWLLQQDLSKRTRNAVLMGC